MCPLEDQVSLAVRLESEIKSALSKRPVRAALPLLGHTKQCRPEERCSFSLMIAPSAADLNGAARARQENDDGISESVSVGGYAQDQRRQLHHLSPAKTG